MQDDQFFQENQALPENWDFIATNGASEPCHTLATPDDGVYVQINAALGLMGTLYLRKSTVACEYALQDLKSSIYVLCGLPQTLAFDISSGGIAIASDYHLNQLIQASPFAHQGRPIVTVQIHAAARRKACIVCLKTDCHHQSSTSPLKRKSRQDTFSQRASLLEPTKRTETAPINKRRKTHNRNLRCALDLTSSNPALSLGFPLVDSATF